MSLVGSYVAEQKSARGARALLLEIFGVDPETVLSEMLKDDSSAVLLGRADGRSVAFALVRLRGLYQGSASASSAGGAATLPLWWVAPEFRTSELGGMLLESAGDWSRARGATDLHIAVLPGERWAKTLLETSGFTTRLLVMDRRDR